ncbi:ABC transporter ATP-binding protein [Burkholderiales bacterium]|nr:ABC transporter ATP-binding protein [Burkholderiales bacterium]
MRAVIEAVALTKKFSGLTAVSGVSLSCQRGMIHAVIGPNGAGKSTLINLLSGELRPTEGKIVVDGMTVTGFGPTKMSLLGVGRSYQRTNIYPSLSVLENCNIAVQSRLDISMRFLGALNSYPDVEVGSKRVMERLQIDTLGHKKASELSHGEQRQVEIALALATEPKVLLLDEPLAGMGAEESSKIVELLLEIRSDFAVILVEHDMDAVFALADKLTVMLNGEVIESGKPDVVRSSYRVQEAYLGEGIDE